MKPLTTTYTDRHTVTLGGKRAIMVYTGVAADVAAGRGLAETQTRVTLEAYKGWDRYDTNLQGHIAQVYATLKGTR